MSHSPIIIALDIASAEEARKLVARLGEPADFYKVGLELYAAAGMDFVRELKAQGKRVFLDLKLYDIPEQVKRAVAVISRSGADFLTIHAVKPVMKAAVEGRGEALKLLAVTVLTSFDDDDVREDGSALPLEKLVEKRVVQAIGQGNERDRLFVAGGRPSEGHHRIEDDAGDSGSSLRGKSDRRSEAGGDAGGRDGERRRLSGDGRQVTRAPDPRAELHQILDELAEHSNAH